jgi:hypothetical protein
MIELCQIYNVTLAHSTPYYPQGNELAESSNKILIGIIKKLLAKNKRGWNSKLKYVLWDDIISTKNSIGTSHFQLVYGTYVIFPTQFGLPVLKCLQEELEEPNNIQRRIVQIIEVQQRREMLNEKSEAYRSKVKITFDKKTKKDSFQTRGLVLRWDAKREHMVSLIICGLAHSK